MLAFLAERCFQNADSRVPAAAIWEEYEAYCRSQAAPGLSPEPFFLVLQEIVPSLEIESGHVKGLALLQPEPRQKKTAEDVPVESPRDIKPLLFQSERAIRQAAINVRTAARLVRETLVVVEEAAIARELACLERVRHAARSRRAPVESHPDHAPQA
jgi:hypothetical protein